MQFLVPSPPHSPQFPGPSNHIQDFLGHSLPRVYQNWREEGSGLRALEEASLSWTCSQPGRDGGGATGLYLTWG